MTTPTWDVLVVGRGPVGGGRRALARRSRPPRAGGRQEAVPAREDLRRRPHAAGRPPTARHGPRRAARAVPALRRPAIDRARRDPGAPLARTSRLPSVWICGSAPRPRRDGGRAGGEGRRDAVVGRRGRRPADRGRAGDGRRDQARRHDRAGAREVPRGGRRRELPLRARDRHRARPHVPARHGDPRLLHQPVPRRAVDREPPRPPRPRGAQPAGLRLGVPRGRRHGERRRRPAVDVRRVEGDQHQLA